MKKKATKSLPGRSGLMSASELASSAWDDPLASRPTPLKITHAELHEKISKEVSAAIEPLKSYKDFLDYKSYLSSARTEARQLEDALARTHDRIAELERAVTQFAKSIKTEVEEALR